MLKKRFNLRNMVTIVACLTVSSMLFSSCNQSAKETKAEKYPEQTSRVEELMGSNNVYWKKMGTKYHLYDDCPYMSQGVIFSGTVTEARKLKNITGLCGICEQRAIKAKEESVKK